MSRRRQRTDAAPPGPVLALAAVGAALLLLPLVGLAARVPWRRLGAVLSSPVALDALRLSVVTSLGASLVALVVGLPLALVLARSSLPGLRVLRGLVLLPLVLPPVVGGTALLATLGRTGLLGAPLERATGLVLPFSTAGAVLATAFVATPFLVITVEGALRGLDGRHEGAAATLGADRWTVLRRVTLPMVAPSIGAGVVLTWARALGEFGATITFAGNLQGRTQTLPLAVFVALDGDRDAAFALSLLLVALSLTVVVGLRGRWWREL